ncbi:hypothetical protein AVEN_25471-1 [Araneus ventricosus]|uniref:Uncharacterized protein n=1 Tax=Araneus ventricosus TaxID=182803 RepID=A0A4Y2CSV0_ARAVE|nr:hypothetical protein AVEN_25471-1 [Araneus ventricosus]
MEQIWLEDRRVAESRLDCSENRISFTILWLCAGFSEFADRWTRMAIILLYFDAVAGCTRWFLIVPESGLP